MWRFFYHLSRYWNFYHVCPRTLLNISLILILSPWGEWNKKSEFSLDKSVHEICFFILQVWSEYCWEYSREWKKALTDFIGSWVSRSNKVSWKWSHLSYLHSMKTAKPALQRNSVLGHREEGNGKDNCMLSPIKKKDTATTKLSQTANTISWQHNPDLT